MVCSLRYMFCSLKYMLTSPKVMLCSLKIWYSDRIEGSYHQQENRPIKVWSPLFGRSTQYINGVLTPINCFYVFNICKILCKIGCIMYILWIAKETRDHVQHIVSFQNFPLHEPSSACIMAFGSALGSLLLDFTPFFMLRWLHCI